jgi:hypothetical protein
MKLKGRKVPPPSPVHLTLYREDGDIVLTLQPVMSFDEFQKLCPLPKAPLDTIIATGEQKRAYDDPDFLDRMEKHRKRKINYIFLYAMAATPDLEWENVKLDDPDTWEFLEKELSESFTETEIDKIFIAVNEANTPSEKRRKEAIDHFAHTQVQEVVNSILPTVLDTTPSGELAKELESSHQG